MDLRRWAHVVAVADQHSFVRAAEHVHLSQPALTRSIQAAEAELGLQLFDRGGAEVRATPAGAFVVERARRLLFDSRCLARDVELYRHRELGDTAFGAGPFPAATLLAPLLVELRRAHPGIHLRVEIANWELLAQHLDDERIEFFVADSRALPDDERLLLAPLRRERASFFVRRGHPLAGRRGVSLAQLWDCGVATVRLPAGVREALAQALGLPRADALRIALECDDISLLKAVALGGDTVMGAPNAAVAPELEEGKLVPLTVAGLSHMNAEMAIVTLRGRTPSPMAELVMRRLHRPGTSSS